MLENLVPESLDKCRDTILYEDEETKMSKYDFDSLIHLLFPFAHLDVFETMSYLVIKYVQYRIGNVSSLVFCSENYIVKLRTCIRLS